MNMSNLNLASTTTKLNYIKKEISFLKKEHRLKLAKIFNSNLDFNIIEREIAKPSSIKIDETKILDITKFLARKE